TAQPTGGFLLTGLNIITIRKIFHKNLRLKMSTLNEETLNEETLNEVDIGSFHPSTKDEEIEAKKIEISYERAEDFVKAYCAKFTDGSGTCPDFAKFLEDFDAGVAFKAVGWRAHFRQCADPINDLVRGLHDYRSVLSPEMSRVFDALIEHDTIKAYLEEYNNLKKKASDAGEAAFDDLEKWVRPIQDLITRSGFTQEQFENYQPQSAEQIVVSTLRALTDPKSADPQTLARIKRAEEKDLIHIIQKHTDPKRGGYIPYKGKVCIVALSKEEAKTLLKAYMEKHNLKFDWRRKSFDEVFGYCVQFGADLKKAQALDARAKALFGVNFLTPELTRYTLIQQKQPVLDALQDVILREEKLDEAFESLTSTFNAVFGAREEIASQRKAAKKLGGAAIDQAEAQAKKIAKKAAEDKFETFVEESERGWTQRQNAAFFEKVAKRLELSL
ncbi:MAG: hypothetical protein ACPGRX_03880, partial [Bdellovibrionales bacterium]